MTKVFVFSVIIILLVPLITILDIRPYQENIIGTPTFLQSGLFLVLSLVEAISFVIGIMLLYVARKKLNKMEEAYKKYFSRIVYPVSFLLVSWGPHDWAHVHNNLGISGLLLVEYGFHVTSMIALVIITDGVIHLIRKDIHGGGIKTAN